MQLTPEATVGLMAIFGVAIVAILVTLNRLGIIKFGNGKYCPDHDAFCDSFKEVRDEHLVRGQTLEAHEKRLDEGKIMFAEVKSDIADINGNIKLLLDRSQQRRSTDG